jgi:hypothetical protein
MGLLNCFDPPAFLNDYDGIPLQRQRWSDFVSGCFDVAISNEVPYVRGKAGAEGRVQFYNPSSFDPGGPLLEQPIVWNAFPKELLRAYGRERALVEADRLRSLRSYRGTTGGTDNLDTTPYRPQVEYCEWHVTRDVDTGEIRRVTFTSEPPEYWQALYGVALDTGNGKTVKFPGDQAKMLALYRSLVNDEVQLEDLHATEDIIDQLGNVLVKKGEYNFYNKWNTTHGIVHLCAPPNSIEAEIELGADATVLYENSAGAPIVDAQALCCAGYGGCDRNSDPTIGACVNSLARLGAFVTLPNPVGLYMDHIDISGWDGPAGVTIADCIKIVRGSPGMIERLVVELPPGSNYTVSDLTIGGEPIRYGGQIAECITVKLVGAAAQIGAVSNAPIACPKRCGIDPGYANALHRAVLNEQALPVGDRTAFSYLQTVGASRLAQPRVRSMRHR